MSDTLDARMGNSSSHVPPAGMLPRVFRFGVFEADPRSGELRKNGLKVRLQEQPFQILLMLLERPGNVVSREELRQRLWSNDTFVDFDHGLNTAINKLRDAVGDTAGNPRFVETLARRGYRFIAPVRVEHLGTETRASAAEPGIPPTPADGLAQLRGPESPEPMTGTATETQHLLAKPATTESNRAAAGLGPSEPEAHLPRPARAVTRTLFALTQLVYFVFYIVALTRLEEIRLIVGGWQSSLAIPVMVIALVTASAGIAMRLYLLAAVAFDFRRLGRNFRKLFPVILPLDQLWALAPFLLLPQIGVGAAFGACAALLYLPFSQRTLVRMAYTYE